MKLKLPGITPYPEQITAVETILDVKSGRFLVSSPTGTGKSVIELLCHMEMFPHSWLISPRIEIICGMLDKLGYNYESFEQAREIAYSLQITTPIKFRNDLIAGKIDKLPKWLFIDEGHHESAESYQQLIACLPKDVILIALTATPFRGTPKGTAEFLERWGEPYTVLTIKQAIEREYIDFPHCETWGLVDDDIVEMGSNGEFVISRLTSAVNDKIEHALVQAKDYGFFLPNGQPKRPTLISCPSSGVFPVLLQHAKKMGLKVATMSDETSYTDRRAILLAARKCFLTVCHINTISEGVDLPFRQHLDLAPCMSPVLFSQRFGRTTRPTYGYEESGVYVCTNRNLERHGYLFDGVMPLSVISNAQKVFDGPTERIATRVFGLTSLGKLHGFRIKLTNGLQVTCYNITQMEGHRKHEYFCIAHPQYQNPLFFYKESKRIDDGTGKNVSYDWGKWKLLQRQPDKLEGFKSNPARALSTAQINLWSKHCKRVGVDPEQTLNTRTFQIVPVLLNAGASLV